MCSLVSKKKIKRGEYGAKVEFLEPRLGEGGRSQTKCLPQGSSDIFWSSTAGPSHVLTTTK